MTKFGTERAGSRAGTAKIERCTLHHNKRALAAISGAATVSALMPDARRQPPPTPLVALAAWMLPGAGYWLLGQRSRALTVGITILSLFVIGLLIGGVRCLEVPGYDDQGQRIMTGRGAAEWVMTDNPWSEIRNKPWSIAQVLTGPVGWAAGAWSVWAATDPDDEPATPDRPAIKRPLEAPGSKSHARVNEIGVLYTAVAGMLNLLAIIDAAHRSASPPAR